MSRDYVDDPASQYRLRILLVEASRYRALLLERELSLRFSSAVLTRFDGTAEAVEELHSAAYDVALVDYETAPETFDELLFSIRECRPEIVLIAFGPNDLPKAQRKSAETWADAYIISDDRCHVTLARTIDRFAERWQQGPTEKGEGGILDAQTRSAVIGLTVRTLAHEVNNPLMTILGTAELLLNNPDALLDSQRKKIEMIQESATRIQATLSDLANLGGEVLRKSPVGPMIEARSNQPR